MSVKIKSIRLSSNPNTEVVDSQDGINGKLNKGTDGDLFCIVELVDISNIMNLVKRTVNYRQNGGVWRGLTPKEMLSAVGSTYPGATTQKFETSEYMIGTNKVHSYTTIVLPHEDGLKVANKALQANRATVVVEEVNTDTGEVSKKLTAPENLVNTPLVPQD